MNEPTQAHATEPLLRRVALDYLISYPSDAAPKLDAEEPDEVATFIEALDSVQRAEVLRRMNADAAAKVLVELAAEVAHDVLLYVDAARAARWLALLNDKQRDDLLGKLPDNVASRVREALDFPAGTAGYLMDAGVVTFRDKTTIGEAFDRIRRLQRRVVDVLICDEDDRLTGIVPLQELVGAPLETTLGSLARRSFPTVHGMASRDDVVELLSQHRLASLPVVDLDGRLLGTIRYDGLVLAAQQAAAEDLQTMVGAGKEERALSSPWFTVKSRLPWLLISKRSANHVLVRRERAS